MDVELWGAQSEPLIELPSRPGGLFILLALILAGLVLALLHGRRWSSYTRRQWLITAGLASLGFLASQFVIVSLPPGEALPPIGEVAPPQRLFYLLGGLPLMIAAAALLPAQAVLVGLLTGLSRGLWQTGSAFDPLQYAAVAGCASLLINQPYRGWQYRILRWPIVAGVVSYLLILPAGNGLAAALYTPPSASALAAFDLGRSILAADWLPALLEALLAGTIASLLLWGVPQISPRPDETDRPPPFSRTIRGRLLTRFTLFSIFLTISLGLLVFQISRGVARDLILRQMVDEANGVSSAITDFRLLRQNLLLQYSSDPRLLGPNGEEQVAALQQLYRTGTFFRRVLLIDTAGTSPSELNGDNIRSFIPDDTSRLQLANPERAAVVDALRNGRPIISQADALDSGRSTLSFVVPLPAPAGEGQPTRVLVGRVNELSFERELITNLASADGTGFGFIVDEEERIIAHPDPEMLLTTWQPLADDSRVVRSYANTDISPGFTGQAIEGLDGRDNTRQLLYYVRQSAHPWTVVIALPYEVVLQEAVDIAGPLVLAAFAAAGVFLLVLLTLSRSISRPLNDLLAAARGMTAGDYTPVEAESFGFDEVGELGVAFMQMQRTLSKRLSELTLLLDVSQSVSASLNNLQEGVRPILRGAVRGTGAAGVRIIVVNPLGRRPLSFGEGPAAERMAPFDRPLWPLLQQTRELIMPTPTAVRTKLDVLFKEEKEALPFQAAIALALISDRRLSGILWLAYRDPHEFDESELRLLRTLAGQATVLLENARLYIQAEGGRQQLRAVLDSTTDAVIVTDPTNRIMLLNPAMEEMFGLRHVDVRSRRVADVIDHPALVEVLTARQTAPRSAEITLPTGKTYSAAASTIVNSNGQVQGRVAVLHDITYMKELDEMKSNFVQMVSHDLRSPLTYMTGFTSMLPMAGDLSEKQLEYVAGLQKGIEQMNTLVRNLLDLGRLEAGLELMRAPVLLPEVIQNVIEDYELMAREQGLELVRETAGEIPYLHLDAPLVQQAIANLVTNAIKYAPQSGRIHLKGAIVGQEVVVSVQDHGPGISREDQKQLYEKFVRGARPDPQVKGSGLGLAIVKLVAERHGGRAWFESRPQAGSTFFISFPLEPVKTLISE